MSDDGQNYDDGRFDNIQEPGGKTVGFKSQDETVEVDGTIETTTPKAVLWNDNATGKQVWLPKGQIVSQSDADEEGTVVMNITDWIAKKNGLG